MAAGKPPYDVFVIGGGVNGCGIARDAAGRGFSVFLAEKGDLASGTSSRSTKLVHGGLRYLEHYAFRLVRKSLREREVLWRNAPHIVWPLRFVLPHAEGMRPAWLLRLGLFLYDHMGGRRLLPPTATRDMTRDAAGAPLKPLFRKAFEYSDCWVIDARLVVLTARDAADRGAVIRTRAEVVSAKRADGLWQVRLRDGLTGETRTIAARLLVNAGGPWVDRVIARTTAANGAGNVRLVQGSHIVVPKLYDHDRCYIFQNADGRIVFAIPYEDDHTLIGTTDRDYGGDPDAVAISAAETDYLCAAASDHFARPVTPADVVWSYSGLRPLFDDGAGKAQDATRDFVLRLDGDAASGVLINLFGGKITTYRRLAETVMDRIEEVLGRRGAAWTESAPLPGGDFPVDGFDDQVARLVAAYPFLDPPLARRLARHYGTKAAAILGAAAGPADLGRHFGHGLYEAEVRYLVAAEWALTADDILWRRTKLGLKFGAEARRSLDAFLASCVQRRPIAAEQRRSAVNSTCEGETE